ncbi:phage related protein/predicted endonuclease [Ralstonia solanacearum UW551]|uniref:Phage related protein/predicted endonuclease n=1 Tax=Ralstonia solanacearum (strain UW551) TaxID=342110 RepID=A0AB33V7P4_RALSU|nr:phage related protein/predicted endonuclease [Ralstonia solanacearum UW551]
MAVYRIERDDELIARLIPLEAQFWHYVETDTPPPGDGSESADRALRCLYPRDSGGTVDFSDDRQLSATFCRHGGRARTDRNTGSRGSQAQNKHPVTPCAKPHGRCSETGEIPLPPAPRTEPPPT